MDKKIKVGLIGFGYWGPNLARNFAASELYDLAWIADVNSRAQALAKKYYPSAHVTPRHSDILNDEGVELVAIATPPATHYQIARESLRAGKHVLVEKPLTTVISEARDLVEISRKQHKVLAVDHPFLYSAPIRKLKRLIEEGEIGDVFFIDAQRLNLGLVQRDVNVFWDLAVHDVCIVDYLLGKTLPLGLIAEGERYTQEHQHEFGTVSLRYPEKKIANITVSWLSPIKVRRMMVVGSKKMAHFDDVHPDEKLKIIDKGIEYSREKDRALTPIYRWGDVVVPRLESKEPLSLEIEELYRAIREGGTLPSLGEDGLRVLKILSAINESLVQRREIKLC